MIKEKISINKSLFKLNRRIFTAQNKNSVLLKILTLNGVSKFSQMMSKGSNAILNLRCLPLKKSLFLKAFLMYLSFIV